MLSIYKAAVMGCSMKFKPTTQTNMQGTTGEVRTNSWLTLSCGLLHVDTPVLLYQEKVIHQFGAHTGCRRDDLLVGTLLAQSYTGFSVLNLLPKRIVLQDEFANRCATVGVLSSFLVSVALVWALSDNKNSNNLTGWIFNYCPTC